MQQPQVLQWSATVNYKSAINNGSLSNYITQRRISALGLKTIHHTTKLNGVGSLLSYREIITVQIMPCYMHHRLQTQLRISGNGINNY